MIQMLFFIRFGGPLRRTRPELIESLEKTVTASASAAGSSAESGRKIITASFDENRIGFWLDMLVLIKKVHRALEEAGPELYGYALVLGRDIPEILGQKLCRSQKENEATGIWCSEEVRKALDFYIVFRPSARTGDISDGYRELLEFRSFARSRKAYPYQEKLLALGNNENSLILRPKFANKKDGIFHYCKSLLGDVPPLLVRFGASGCGLICFADAWTHGIRSFVAGAFPGADREEILAELDLLHALLFRERLREEWSPNISTQCSRFIRSLLTAYIAAVKTQLPNGLLIIEDSCLADEAALEVFREVYSSLDERKALLVLACDRKSVDLPEELIRNLPLGLWESSYNIFLLGRYFPAYLLPQLFEEEGLNPNMYIQVQEMLTALGMFVSDDPRPLLPNFTFHAEEALGERKDKILSAVRNRILSWAHSGRLQPCFDLLRVLSELGKRAGDALILKALKADVLNGTCGRIEEALEKGYFASLVGDDNVQVLGYIYKTLKALILEGSNDIRRAFSEELPSISCYGGYRSQVQANLAAFNIGIRKIDAASEAVRKAMLINRDLGENAVPAYRFSSLVNLTRRRINDALEYISFALEQAEATEQNEEIFLTCYFASSINLLYGNLSKAKRLARRAEETALALGWPGWGMRAKFLRGRLCFEAGLYEDALEIFESLAAGTEPQHQAMAHTVQAWVFRTNNFLGRFSQPIDAALAGPDAELFRIEEAYLTADYERAITLAEAFLSPKGETPNEDFLFTEQPDWRSGFSQCEYMFQPRKAPGVNFAWVYRAMAQCAFISSKEAKTEILSGMQRFMREELLPDTDSNDVFYFHAWYCMIRDSRNPKDSRNPEIRGAHAEMNTVVSMALRRLQRRADRIDDKETKQAFQNMPRWNSALYSAARELRLI